MTSSLLKDKLIPTGERKRQAEEKRFKKLETKKMLKFTSLKQCKGKMNGEQPSTYSANIICPVCEEEFTESPEEDWIQCTKCKEWWHEACSNNYKSWA